MTDFNKRIVYLIVVFLSVFGSISSAVIFDASEPELSGKWIWGSSNDVSKSIMVELASYMEACPGCAGNVLVDYILSNISSACIKKVYWRLDDDDGYLLFPVSNQSRVLEWENWGVSFTETDYPKLAWECSQKYGLELILAISQEDIQLARDCYPEIDIVALPETEGSLYIQDHFVSFSEIGSFAALNINKTDHYFRKSFYVKEYVSSAKLWITAQNSYEVYIDGKLVFSDDNWEQLEEIDLTSYLSIGIHVIAVKVFPSLDSTSGILLDLKWKYASGRVNECVTDHTWKFSTVQETSWNSSAFDESSWNNAVVVGLDGSSPRTFMSKTSLKEIDRYCVMVLRQDFEDTKYFTNLQSLGLSGIGDAGNIIGNWQNPFLDIDCTPRVVLENSDYSEGSQCVMLDRTSVYGTGFLKGVRAGIFCEDVFEVDIALKMEDLSGQFALKLVDSFNEISPRISVAYFGSVLYVADNGSWSSRYSNILPGQWFRLKIYGQISAGKYNISVYQNPHEGWLDLGEASFDNSELVAIDGIEVTPWSQDTKFYVDDIFLVAYPSEDCSEIIRRGYGLKSDVNNDCYVDFDDFYLQALDWLKDVDLGLVSY